MSMSIKWDQSLSVGDPTIDADHKHLIDLFNQLHDAMSAGKGRDSMDGTLRELVRYTQEHFAREERAMERTRYPEMDAHKAEHRKLIEQVSGLMKEWEAGKSSVTIHTMQFLRDWLTNHIKVTDTKVGAYLRSQKTTAA